MKIKQFKIGDRVVDEYLGNGTVKEILKNFYLVIFDNVPDIRYNGGNKECLVLPNNIKGI